MEIAFVERDKNGSFESSLRTPTVHPVGLIVFKYWVHSRRLRRLGFYVYCTATTLMVVFLLVYIGWHIKGIIEGKTFSVAYLVITLFYIGQTFLNCFLPFWIFPFIKDIVDDESIVHLFTDVSRYPNNSFIYTCKAIDVVNGCLSLTASITFLFIMGDDWEAVLSVTLWLIIYFTPCLLLFSLSLCILEAHRQQADHLIHRIRSLRKTRGENRGSRTQPGTSESSVEDLSPIHSKSLQGSESDVVEISSSVTSTLRNINDQYYDLLHLFLTTSEQRGKLFFALICIPFVLLLSSILSHYEDIYNQRPFLGFTILALCYLFEIGWLLATVNETGSLLCRELSSYLLCCLSESRNSPSLHQLSSQDVHEMTASVACLSSAKAEIPFFGNFSLHFSTLLAMLGSLLAAAVPAITK